MWKGHVVEHMEGVGGGDGRYIYSNAIVYVSILINGRNLKKT